MTKPAKIFDGQVNHESVLVMALAGYRVAEDIHAGISADDQAEDDLSALARGLRLCVVGVRQVGPVLEALLGHVEIVKADYGDFVVAAGMRATLFT